MVFGVFFSIYTAINIRILVGKQWNNLNREGRFFKEVDLQICNGFSFIGTIQDHSALTSNQLI